MAVLDILSQREPRTFRGLSLIKSEHYLCCCLHLVPMHIDIFFRCIHTPLDNRILLPVFLCLMFFMLLLFKKCSDNFRQLTRVLLYMVACVFLLMQIMTFQKNLALFINDGITYNGVGYSSKIWITSKSVDYVRSLPERTVIYSNGPEIINLLLDRPSTMIPQFINPVNRLKNQNFSAEFKNMMEDIKSNNGYLVYFVNINWRWYLPSLPLLVQSLKDFEIYKTEDGYIFLSRKQ